MKHKIRRVLAAGAVLASTLVAGTATPAGATTYSHYGERLNNAFMYTLKNSAAGATVSTETTLSFDSNSLPYNAEIHYPRAKGAFHAPGASATLYLKTQTISWDETDPTICQGSVDDPNQVLVEIRNSSGVQVGSWDWTPTYQLGCSETDVYAAASTTVYFDGNPLDGDNLDGALAPGKYTLYMKFIDTDGTNNANQSGQDSLGAHALGPNASESTASAYFYVGRTLAGFGHEGNNYKESKWIDDDLGKHFPVVRDFATTWGLPSSTRITGSSGYAADGSAVVWSVKPKAAGGGNSAWKNTELDTTMIDAQLVALQNAATTYGIPWMSYTVNHEPKGEVGSNGTAAEFRSLYKKIMERKQVACSGVCDKVLIMYIEVPSNMDEGSVVIGRDGLGNEITELGGGTDVRRPQHAEAADTYATGSSTIGSKTYTVSSGAPFQSTDLGLPITGTNIAADTYIREIVSSSSVKLSKNATGTGSNLTFAISRKQDYDLLGADPYNWGCFRKQDAFNDAAEIALGTNKRDLSNNTSSCTDDAQGGNNEWRSLEEALDGLMNVAKRVDKKIFLAEVGSHPGCNAVEDNFQYGDYPEAPYDYVAPASESKYVMHGFFCNGSLTDDLSWDRGAWFNQMFEYLLTPEAQQYIVGLTYYHSNNCEENKGNCWDFVDFNDEGTSTPDLMIEASDNRGRQAWIDNVVNSAFQSAPFAFNLDPTP